MEKQQHLGSIQLLNYSMGRPLDEALMRHVEQCPECREKVAELQKERSEFDASVDAEEDLEDFLRRRETQRPVPVRTIRWAAAAGAGMLVVGLFVFLMIDQSDTSRLKGTVNANVYVKRGEEVVRADADFLYRKGDKIRLGILSPAPVFVTVLVEKEGDWSPIPNLTDVAVPPGKEKILPGSMSISCSGDSEAVRLRISKMKIESESGEDLDSRVIVFKCEQP